jgi:Planctomycete cytochrome C/WD domain, G-beta repeat
MLRSRFCFCWLCVTLVGALAYLMLLAAPPSAHAQAPPAGPVSFINDVAPILRESCFGCHGSKNPRGKLDMTRYESFRKGGTKEDPIVPGKPEESYLIDALQGNGTASRMPPKEAGDPLAKEKIALLERWIKEGAKLDAGIAKDTDLPRELRNRWKPPTPYASYPFAVTINSVAFTPDNLKLVVGGHHELTVWDVASGKLEKRIYTRCRRAMAMVFLPDGKLVVAGGRPGEEGDVRVYDINGGTPKVENGVAVYDGVNDPKVMLKKLLDSDDEVLALAVSADGKKLASGGCDRIVNVWDLSPGVAGAVLAQSFENHADWVFGVAFSPDGNTLLTCSRDKTAKVWDLVKKESLFTFPEHQNSVNGVAFKADGKLAFSVGDDNQLRAWNTTGDQGGKQVRAQGGHGKAVLKLVTHPKQPLQVTASADMTVRIWNADSGAALRTLSGHTDHVFSVAISPDANLVASGAWNGEVKIWKVADGTVLKAFNASPGLVVAAPPAPPKK